jgi:hypothetical protein
MTEQLVELVGYGLSGARAVRGSTALSKIDGLHELAEMAGLLVLQGAVLVGEVLGGVRQLELVLVVGDGEPLAVTVTVTGTDSHGDG